MSYPRHAVTVDTLVFVVLSLSALDTGNGREIPAILCHSNGVWHGGFYPVNIIQGGNGQIQGCSFILSVASKQWTSRWLVVRLRHNVIMSNHNDDQ